MDIISPLSGSISTRTPLQNSNAISSSSSSSSLEIVDVTGNASFEEIFYTRESAGLKSNPQASVKAWKCKLCSKTFTGSVLGCINHMLRTDPFANEQTAFCIKVTKAATEAARIRKDAVLSTTNVAANYNQNTMTRHFQPINGGSQHDGEMLLLELLVVDKLAPFLLDSSRFIRKRLHFQFTRKT